MHVCMYAYDSLTFTHSHSHSHTLFSSPFLYVSNLCPSPYVYLFISLIYRPTSPPFSPPPPPPPPCPSRLSTRSFTYPLSLLFSLLFCSCEKKMSSKKTAEKKYAEEKDKRVKKRWFLPQFPISARFPFSSSSYNLCVVCLSVHVRVNRTMYNFYHTFFVFVFWSYTLL